LPSFPSHTEPDPSPSKRSYNPIRDQRTRTAPTSKSPSASPAKKRTKKETASKTEVSPSKAKSLRNFFQPATEEQRWSKQRFNTKSISLQAPLPYDGIEDEEQDLIEDYEEESFNDIFAHYITNEAPPAEQVGATAVGKATLEKNASSRPSRRFLLPKSAHAKADHSDDNHSNGNPALSDDASRPWSERFAPCNLEELAVHKKKVADVQNWLIESFTGRSKRVCISFHH
jgi:cell cycle checkpoint protein